MKHHVREENGPVIRLSSRGIEAAGSHQNRTCGCGLDIRPSYPGNPTVWPQSGRMEETIKVFQNKTIQCDLHEKLNCQMDLPPSSSRTLRGWRILEWWSAAFKNRTRTLLTTRRCEVEVFMCNMKTVQNFKSTLPVSTECLSELLLGPLELLCDC